MRSFVQQPVRSNWTVMLLLTALNLVGCETTCPKPTVESQQLPSPPSVSTQQPSEPYTVSAKRNSQKRHERLMATQVMSNSSAKPGQSR